MSIRASRPHNATGLQEDKYIINVYKANGLLPIHLSKCKNCKGKATILVNRAVKPAIKLEAYCDGCLNKSFTKTQLVKMVIK